mgnify:CR=1 FL=1
MQKIIDENLERYYEFDDKEITKNKKTYNKSKFKKKTMKNRKPKKQSDYRKKSRKSR